MSMAKHQAPRGQRGQLPNGPALGAPDAVTGRHRTSKAADETDPELEPVGEDQLTDDREGWTHG
jgi:hypothetical protein